MAKEATSAPVSPVTKGYQDAMARLAAGDLTAAVRAMLRLHEEHPATEEAYFVEEQLARVRKLWPAEAEKAGLTADKWSALQSRAAERRAKAVMPNGVRAVVVLLLVAAAWSLLVAAAPRAAFIGKLAEVPLIFRLVAAIVGVTSAATGFAMIRLKWEAVNVFILLAPIFMIATFIGLTETGDAVGKVICGVALAAEVAAAWYMSKHSDVFVH